MRMSHLSLAAVSLFTLWSGSAAALDLPMQLEGDRPYIDVEFTAVDGHLVKAHAWLDTGGGGLVFTQKFAEALGLSPKDGGFQAEGDNLASVDLPALHIAGTEIKLTDAQAFEVLGSATGLQHTDADVALPVHLLRSYDVVFDYPKHRFSLLPSGGKHSGTEVPVHIGDAGMPTVTVQIDGKPYGVLLDTGGTCVMLSRDAMSSWLTAHGDWQKLDGAYGRGDMGLGKFESKLFMLDIPRLDLGPFPLEQVLAVSRPAGIYEKNMTQLTGAPIVGSLGGNVFRAFRIEIDYPLSKLYLTRDKSVKPAALDMVGISIEPVAGGGFDVANLQGDTGTMAVGDHLLKVDGLDVSQATLQAVLAALAGKPGESRMLTVQRGDQTLEIKAPVQHLLGAKD
jgi:hypothetical protein